MRNNSGKALTIFLILISVIFVSLTAISVFLLVKQVELRESEQARADELQKAQNILKAELQETKKQNEILDLKVKETEEKVENLLGELDLAQEVRDQVRQENRTLQESLEAVKKASEDAKTQFAKKEQEAASRMTDLQSQLDAALERNKTLEERRQELEKEFMQLQEKLAAYQVPSSGAMQEDSAVLEEGGVNLDKIVVNAAEMNQGRVISVDQEAEFVIINLGERHGAVVDTVLSVYSDDKYIGDLKVTKVLPEMCAADIHPPLTSRDISEGDIVKLKE